MGEAVRYDGRNSCHHLSDESKKLLQAWEKRGLLLLLCPEVAGGLSVPRVEAEIQPNQTVLSKEGIDVTKAFNLGAEQALKLCQLHNLKFAILKQGSPSCGNSLVYDGTFSGTKIKGAGMTTRLLEKHDIQVFNELEIERLSALL